MAILKFAYISREEVKPTKVLTDNRSVTRFFGAKAIQPSLWNVCNYVLQIKFKKAHIVRLFNTAADFVSRLEPKVTRRSVSKSEKSYDQHPLR